jgi:hypothetical protein
MDKINQILSYILFIFLVFNNNFIPILVLSLSYYYFRTDYFFIKQAIPYIAILLINFYLFGLLSVIITMISSLYIVYKLNNDIASTLFNNISIFSNFNLGNIFTYDINNNFIINYIFNNMSLVFDSLEKYYDINKLFNNILEKKTQENKPDNLDINDIMKNPLFGDLAKMMTQESNIFNMSSQELDNMLNEDISKLLNDDINKLVNNINNKKKKKNKRKK